MPCQSFARNPPEYPLAPAAILVPSTSVIFAPALAADVAKKYAVDTPAMPPPITTIFLGGACDIPLRADVNDMMLREIKRM